MIANDKRSMLASMNDAHLTNESRYVNYIQL